MATFQVQLWPDGQWDQKPFRKVDAATPKEAAEKLYGKPLRERGANALIRARVWSLSRPNAQALVFFEE
jgi:hypothetical protein